MKIKQKLVSSIGLLFFMIVLLTVLSTVYIYKLSTASKNILVANYNTIDYSRKMLIALNTDSMTSKAWSDFNTNLMLQQHNITEVGEDQLTQKLKIDFQQLQANSYTPQHIRILQKDVLDLILLNMQAIQRKSQHAELTAEQSLFWVNSVGVLCFIIAFIVLVNLPSNIANPIKELSKSILDIAKQNYSSRVHFESHNEFGDLAKAFNTMAQKLEEYQAGAIEKLLIEKKRIETLINNMNEPVIGLDASNSIVFMNNNALQITSLKADAVIGKSIQEVANHNDLVRKLIQDLSPTEHQTETKHPIKIYANNKESYFQKEVITIKIIPTGEQEEKYIGTVILLQNITEYKELDLAKTNFVANISHELKTPIASIKMSLQLLENKKIGLLNGEQEQLLESINDDANRLLKITKELLSITEVESGVIQLTVKPIPIHELVDYALNATKNSADQKGIQMHVMPYHLDTVVLADSEKMAWVLTNLISNAIRYSYEHSAISIAVKKQFESVVISVSDTGQGISPKYLSKIFERYFRIPGSKREGTGLGLSISKEFIEAQGGSIHVESELGKGSTFSILILIDKASL